LERKLRELGLSSDGSGGAKRFTFRLFFPRPPHHGVEYRAAKTKEGFNFVGLVLGHGGVTLQRIQKQTGTKIEIQDKRGNLNGAHPSANDPTLHALVTADSKEKLHRAVEMVVEVLQPLNTEYEPLAIQVNGSATLEPVLTEELLAEEAEAVTDVQAEVPPEAPTKPNPSAEEPRRTPLSYNLLNAQSHGRPALAWKGRASSGGGVPAQENGAYTPINSAPLPPPTWATHPTTIPAEYAAPWNDTALSAAQGASLPWGSGNLTKAAPTFLQPPGGALPAEWSISPRLSPDSTASSYDPLAGLALGYGGGISHPMQSFAPAPTALSPPRHTYGGGPPSDGGSDMADASIDHLKGLLLVP